MPVRGHTRKGWGGSCEFLCCDLGTLLSCPLSLSLSLCQRQPPASKSATLTASQPMPARGHKGKGGGMLAVSFSAVILELCPLSLSLSLSLCQRQPPAGKQVCDSPSQPMPVRGHTRKGWGGSCEFLCCHLGTLPSLSLCQWRCFVRSPSSFLLSQTSSLCCGWLQCAPTAGLTTGVAGGSGSAALRVSVSRALSLMHAARATRLFARCCCCCCSQPALTPGGPALLFPLPPPHPHPSHSPTPHPSASARQAGKVGGI